MSLFAITLSCGHVAPMMAYHGQPLCNCKRYRLGERLRRLREARERAGAHVEGIDSWDVAVKIARARTA